MEVGSLSGTWLREMHRNPSIRVAAKLRLCALDRPDTEAGGALIQMACVGAKAALHETGGQYVVFAAWKPHDMRSFHGMLTDAMRPPWGDITNHGGGWVVGETRVGGLYPRHAANGTPRAAMQAD